MSQEGQSSIKIPPKKISLITSVEKFNEVTKEVTIQMQKNSTSMGNQRSEPGPTDDEAEDPTRRWDDAGMQFLD